MQIQQSTQYTITPPPTNIFPEAPSSIHSILDPSLTLTTDPAQKVHIPDSAVLHEDGEQKAELVHYDTIAKEYEDAKRHLHRSVVEAHSFFKVLGDVTGLRVLDLACGNGHYTRRIYERGAKEVAGVDISSEMIKLANDKERKKRNIWYTVADVSNMGIIGSGNWDVVTAVFLFCYAPTVAQLRNYFQATYDNIAPGGRLVSVNDCQSNESMVWGPQTRKYGYVKTALTSTNDGGKDGLHMMKDGDSFKIDFFNPGCEPFSITNYHHSHETVEAICHEVGFTSVRWISAEVSAEGYEKMRHDPGHWDHMMENPPFTIMEATK